MPQKRDSRLHEARGSGGFSVFRRTFLKFFIRSTSTKCLLVYDTVVFCVPSSFSHFSLKCLRNHTLLQNPEMSCAWEDSFSSRDEPARYFSAREWCDAWWHRILDCHHPSPWKIYMNLRVCAPQTQHTHPFPFPPPPPLPDHTLPDHTTNQFGISFSKIRVQL